MGRHNLLLTLCVLLSLFFPGEILTAPSVQPEFLPGHPRVVGNQVLLNWSILPIQVRYRIYLDGKYLTTVDYPPFITSLPNKPGSYKYQLSAEAPTGEESPLSSPGIIQVRGIEKPQNMYGVVGNQYRSIDLVWDVVPEANVYKVFRAEAGEMMNELAETSDHRYRDTSAQPGVWYVYAVSAVDILGRKGPLSDELDMEIDAFKASKAAIQTVESSGKAQVLPVREVFSIKNISGTELKDVTDLISGQYGDIWVVTPSTREIHQLDSSGEHVFTIGPGMFGRREHNIIPHKMDIGPDGRIYVSDARQGKVACVDNNGNVVWKMKLNAPDKSNTMIWAGFPDSYPSLRPTPSNILCLAEELWVTDQRFQLIYRVSYDGKLKGYLAHYMKGDDVWRFRRVGEVRFTADGKFLITFPLAKKILALDETFTVVYEVDGSEMSKTPRVGAIQGVNPTDDGRLLITDSLRGRIALYRISDGEFLYHFSGENRSKPLFINKPAMATKGPKGRFWVYVAGENRLSVLEQIVVGK